MQINWSLSYTSREFIKEIGKYLKTNAKKKEDGTPEVQTTELGEDYYKFEKDKVDFLNQQLKALDEKYKDKLEENKKQNEDYNKIAEEESKVDLYKIKLEYIEDVIDNQMQSDILEPIIKEE